MTSVEKARLRALQDWADSMGFNLVARCTFSIIERGPTGIGNPSAAKFEGVTKVVSSLDEVVEVLGVLTEERITR